MADFRAQWTLRPHIEVTFSFLEFVSACKKSVYTIYSFFLLVLWPDWPHPFSPCPPKKFTVNFQIVPIFKKLYFFESFSQFLGKFFPNNPYLSRTISYGFLASSQNLVKDRKTAGQKDERMTRPYCIGPFGLKSSWATKIVDSEQLFFQYVS